MTVPAIVMSMLIIIVLINTMAALLVLEQLHHNQASIHRLEASIAKARNQLRKQHMDADALEERKDALETLVDSGTRKIETFHQAISTTTFSVIDKLSRSSYFRASTTQVRQTHNGTSQGVYHSIRIANRELHSMAEIFLKQKRRKERRPSPPDDDLS